MKTISVLIGNSDNRLSQAEWSTFFSAVEKSLQEFLSRLHFSGCSLPNSPYQNACWVGECRQDELPELRILLHSLRVQFQQDKIALVTGETELLG